MNVRTTKRWVIIGSLIKFFVMDYLGLALALLTIPTIIGVPELIRICIKHWRSDMEEMEELMRSDLYTLPKDTFLGEVASNFWLSFS